MSGSQAADPDAGYRDLKALRWGFPAAAVAIAALAVATDPDAEAWHIGLLLVMVGAIAAWGVWPDLCLLLVAGVVGPALVVGAQMRMEPGLFLLVLATLIIAGSLDVSGWKAATAVAVLLATPPAIALFQAADRPWSWWIWDIAIVFTWTMGRTFRRQVMLANQLDQTRRELADQAVLEERRRIARDVHDLVGHGLSAVLLQVAGARHVLRRDPDAADEALRVAQEAGRRSMADLRRTIGSLRAEGESGLDAPLAAGEGLDELVAEARASGLDVHADLDADTAALAGTIGVAVHRIAQEALVNARRHAPRARTEVRLGIEGDDVNLTVESIGALDPEGDGDHEGYGIVGMRERATAAGGTFAAGPTPGGWRVECRIPLTVQPGPGGTAADPTPTRPVCGPATPARGPAPPPAGNTPAETPRR